MTSCIGFLISMFGTQMCGKTLLFIVIANCAIANKSQQKNNIDIIIIIRRCGSVVKATDLHPVNLPCAFLNANVP